MSRPATCAHCKAELARVIRPCARCKKNFCSPVVRDCVFSHGCKGEVVIMSGGMRAALH